MAVVFLLLVIETLSVETGEPDLFLLSALMDTLGLREGTSFTI